MAISTSTIFISITIVVLASVVMSLSSFGAGLNEKDQESPAFKAAVSFVGISGGVIFIAIMFVVFKALVSDDSGRYTD